MANYEEAFELTGYGIFNHAVLLSSSLILMHAMLESIGMAYVITGAECELHLSIGEKGAINAAVFIGITVTAIPWGTISDRYGRRSVMLPAIFVTMALSFFSALSKNFWTMFILRMLVGCAVSASSATCLVYLGEMHTETRRDFAIASAISIVAFAFCIVPAIAWPIIPGRWSIDIGLLKVRPWRVFMWTWAMPGLCGAVLLFLLPESPRYILAAKGAAFAVPIVAKMFAINHKKSPDEFPLAIVRSSTTVLHKGRKNMWLDMQQLMRPPLLKCVILSHYCMLMVFFLANGLYIWLPDLINEIMKNVGGSKTMCHIIVEKYGKSGLDDDEECDGPVAIVNKLMYPMSIAMEAALFLFFIIILLTIDKYDKTKIYFGIMVPMAAFVGLSAIIPHAGIAGFLLSIGLACGGAASLLSALAVEVFPTSLRALSMCTMFMAGQIGAAMGSNALSLCLEVKTCVIVFILVAIITTVSAISLLFYWPNSKAVRIEMERRNFTY